MIATRWLLLYSNQLVALLTIQRIVHASDTAMHWMAAGYTLAFALLLITGGRLGDVFGYQRLFLPTWASHEFRDLPVASPARQLGPARR